MKLSLLGVVVFCLSFQTLLAKETQTPYYVDKAFTQHNPMVLRSFKIDVPGFKYAFNPSIIQKGGGYALSFRCEPPSNKSGSIRSFIGVVDLNREFQPIGPCRLLNTGNKGSEDARIFKTKDGTYVMYTHVITYAPLVADIALCKVDADIQNVTSSCDLKYKGDTIEKNWTPFTYTNPSGKDEIYFIYKYFPHRILKLNSSVNGSIKIAYEHNDGNKKLAKWQEKWGLIRGGTPAIRLKDEYVAFFHSSFDHKPSKARYYVLGAITFEATPPFRIKKISQEPIFFSGMYSHVVPEDAWFYPRHHLRVMFPSGIVEGKERGKDVFYVVCGENDIAIKGVVIDKKMLLDSLEKCN